MYFIRKIIMALFVAQIASAELPEGLYAEFDTTMGSFTCRLDYAEAPLACANFAGLVEGSQVWVSTNGVVMNEPFYDGLLFHRVVESFMIQGGDPLGTGTGGPGYAFPDQISGNLSHHSAGILSMANSGPDSNGSQFFITLEPTPWLDGKHAVFGEVIDGMEVVSNIGAVATDPGDRPLTNMVMNTVDILRVGAGAKAFNPVAEPLPEVMPLILTLNEHVSAGVSNQCMQHIYSSTNLVDWSRFSEHYSSVMGEDISIEIPTNQWCGFYRGAQIYHPQASSQFSNLEGRTVFFTQGVNTFEFSLAAEGLGTCDIAGTDDTLTYWEEWTSEPYLARVVFEPSGMYAFQFVWPRSGECEGYQYSAFGWQYIGLWLFGEREVIPE